MKIVYENAWYQLITVNSVAVGMMRRGIPREETVTYTAGIDTTNSRAVVKIFDTNIETKCTQLRFSQQTEELDHWTADALKTLEVCRQCRLILI